MAREMKSNRESGYSLVELLVVVAIIAITLGVGTFFYQSAMRSFRPKKAVQDIKMAFMAAKQLASRLNTTVIVTSDGNQKLDVFVDKNGNGQLDPAVDDYMYCVLMSTDTQDPGRPAGIQKDYLFEPLTVLSSQTLTGSGQLSFNGVVLGYDNDNTYDTVPILSKFTCSVAPTGFISIKDAAGNEIPFGSILCLHADDIAESVSTTDRHYALAFAVTGWMKVYKMDVNQDWIEY